MSVFLLLLISSCANYYQKHWDFNSEFEKGDLQKALTTLEKQDNLASGKAKFIYFANNGLLHAVLGNYQASNEDFEKAYLFGEDYRINYVNEAAAYFTNPNLTVYRGEDHEHLMVLYFKAINFLKMGNTEQALVECRRLNIRLNQLSDKYSSAEKYQRDAFIHALMGIIYQSDKDYNNAFIAYRNALEIYEGDYARMFSMRAPEQLKRDLLTSAYRTGFIEEFEKYKLQFGMDDFIPDENEAELVFFWHNGLGPVKDEWSINFLIAPGPDNTVVFTNPNLGISFPFKVDNDKEKSDLGRLEIFRVAFPRYVERPQYFQSALLEINDQRYPLELAEDISKVAFYSLKERMMQEFAKGLLRAALKKASEHSIRKEDERLGALLGIVNAITEKADTRNWQTLPHSIFYSRVALKEGSNAVQFSMDNGYGNKTNYNFTYQAKRGQTLFHTFSSLETSGQSYRY
ncbi:MAG: hypothetical protein JNM57_07290 [Cyclobacteriaceae bacterium]|nr:hypothetical protein [Cyclobacteriaceae bacterium]